MPGEPGRLRRSLYVIGHGVRPDGKSYISGGPFEGDLGIRRYHPTPGAFPSPVNFATFPSTRTIAGMLPGSRRRLMRRSKRTGPRKARPEVYGGGTPSARPVSEPRRPRLLLLKR